MTVDFGFIGAGGIATRHMDHLTTHDDADVVAVCDVDEDTATSVANEYGATAYTDHYDFYRSEALDAVVVAVPPFAHDDQELLAVEHGIDLFVEKPLALDCETARSVEAALAESDVLAQVGHMSRYADAVERARELVADRTISLVDGEWWCGVPDAAWWRVKEMSGGQVVEQATHTFDLFRYFAGDVETVYAVGGQRINTEAIDFEDTTSVSMEHENGVVSQLSATSTATAQFEHEVRLVGEEFVLSISPNSDTLTGTVDGESIDFEGSGDTYGSEMDAFVEAVQTRDESLLRSPYDDARKTFETTLAVDDALDSDGVVEVDE